MLKLLRDSRQAQRGAPAIAARQRARLAELLAYARANSPFYRELYRQLPDRPADLRQLPTTSKSTLMSRFDDWVTDPTIKIDDLWRFVDDPATVGQPFLSRYTVSATSGTTGTPGIFLQDPLVSRVAAAMMARWLTRLLDARDLMKILKGRMRISMMAPTGGHFATTTAAARLRASRIGAKTVQTLSVHAPIDELVDQLNQFQPAILAPYASVGAMLASQAEAGRLTIHPVLITLAADGLPDDEYARIAEAFGATVGNSYAANECLFLSANCHHGWLHVNADWAILEPVDADYQPTPPGQHSHTVLVTNLANHTQPIIRYDLGDSVLARPDPCRCGNPLPAIRVHGRASETLTLPADDASITLPPLALTTLAETVPGVELFQVEQTAPATLRLRTRTLPGTDPTTVRQQLDGKLRDLLTRHGAPHISLEHASEAPIQHPGGKYRAVIPLDTTR
jgi:phenylacetate-coenzyme A ligase PaaK-like adenylate-forming protein